MLLFLFYLNSAIGSELDLPGKSFEHNLFFHQSNHINTSPCLFYSSDIHFGSLHAYDGLMCLVALLTPLLFLYQTLCTTYVPPAITNASTDITTSNSTGAAAAISPTVRTHRPHPAVLYNNNRNSFSDCDTASEGERCTPHHSKRNSSKRLNSNSRSNSTRYSQKHASSRSTKSGKFGCSEKGSRSPGRESHSRKVRRSSSTAEYSQRSAPYSEREDEEEHKEDGVRFSLNKQGLILSTPPRQAHKNNTSPHRPYTATHNTLNNNNESRAIPTMFTFDRDLAVYTHETVTYDQLSAEKAARENNTYNMSAPDHLSQSYMYHSEEEHDSGVSNNGINTSLYQTESDNLTESEEEKRGEWSTDSDNNCGSPKYALNMATSSYNSINLSNKQRLHANHSTHTVRNTAMNRVSVNKAPSPVSTPPASDNDCDSSGSFGRADNAVDTQVVRSAYSPSSSVNGSVKGSNTAVKTSAKPDRPIWHSMFSDPSDGEEELPLRRIPSIYTSPHTTKLDPANTASTKPNRSMPAPLLLAPLHTNNKPNKYAGRPLPPLPTLSSDVTTSPVSPEVEYGNTSIYSIRSAFSGDNVLATASTKESKERAVDTEDVQVALDLNSNVINNYTDIVPSTNKEHIEPNKTDSVEIPIVHTPVIMTVKCRSVSEDSQNNGSVDGTMATLFGNNRNKSNVAASPKRVIVKPEYTNNSKGIWGMVRNVFGGNHNHAAGGTKPPVGIVNSGLSGQLLRTMTDIDFNEIEDRENVSSQEYTGNSMNHRGNRCDGKSSDDNIDACYAYEGSSNFTEGNVDVGYDV